jgi:TetR/AcrR family transcriptional repressor of nem operon
MAQSATRDLVLDVAQELLQTRGFNAFSFRDLAERVRIKTASVHYYFPTKSELCRALITRFRTEVRAALTAIDSAEEVADRKLDRYVSLFRSMLESGNRMCLCGMLASDITTLDSSIVTDLREAFEEEEAWLVRVLSDGKRTGRLCLTGSPRVEARLLLCALEGATLVARAFEDLDRFEASGRMLLTKLRPKSSA